jgi:hypothetical protein
MNPNMNRKSKIIVETKPLVQRHYFFRVYPKGTLYENGMFKVGAFDEDGEFQDGTFDEDGTFTTGTKRVAEVLVVNAPSAAAAERAARREMFDLDIRRDGDYGYLPHVMRELHWLKSNFDFSTVVIDEHGEPVDINMLNRIEIITAYPMLVKGRTFTVVAVEANGDVYFFNGVKSYYKLQELTQQQASNLAESVKNFGSINADLWSDGVADCAENSDWFKACIAKLMTGPEQHFVFEFGAPGKVFGDDALPVATVLVLNAVSMAEATEIAYAAKPGLGVSTSRGYRYDKSARIDAERCGARNGYAATVLDAERIRTN